ncbi:MAG: glycosyltransferase family 2 protein [Anaerolineae bacterium]|nr:glycosyltransferase family 2 protein [Anaerolineae bacterium]
MNTQRAPAATTTLSIIIPCYRSGEGLPRLIERLEAVLPSLASAYEVLLVDDASPDDTWQAVEDLAHRYAWVRGIQLMRNYGQHNALLCGIRAAAYEIVVTMDDDLQHPPDQIHLLLDKLAEGYDVVYGAPEREQHGIWRDLASQITKIMLQSSMGVDNARHVSAFRAFRTKVRNAFVQYQNPYVSIDVLLTWGTTRFAAITVRHDTRQYGVSHYTVRKLIRHAINMITGFSTMPLRVASIVGFAMTLFGLLVLIYVVGRALFFGIVVPGFAFLASVIAIFAGAQLFALGVIGEYLARIYFRSMDRPAYTMRTTSDESNTDDTL